METNTNTAPVRVDKFLAIHPTDIQEPFLQLGSITAGLIGPIQIMVGRRWESKADCDVIGTVADVGNAHSSLDGSEWNENKSYTLQWPWDGTHYKEDNHNNENVIILPSMAIQQQNGHICITSTSGTSIYSSDVIPQIALFKARNNIPLNTNLGKKLSSIKQKCDIQDPSLTQLLYIARTLNYKMMMKVTEDIPGKQGLMRGDQTAGGNIPAI
ncbi:hypothetical protein V2J09_006228 [Rumex salicifolius]